MRAMVLTQIGSMGRQDQPLRLCELPRPEPAANEVLIRVSVCGVCHTELDEIEGRTRPPVLPVVPGHEAVGAVVACGRDVTRHRPGDRVGVGWIYSSTGEDNENLAPEFRATGRDANGGYAEYLCVGERYAYPIPAEFTDEEAAPLLCAGAVGYRALRLSGIGNGDSLGLTGFGGSAHIVLQVVRYRYPDTGVYVFARSEREQRFALELGATWAGGTQDMAPVKLDAVIDTTPAWLPVIKGLENLRPGGRLVINAIRKESADQALLGGLSYERHLWQEKEVKTVANVTHQDIAEFLPLAAAAGVRPHVRAFELADANLALHELKFGHLRGAFVLRTTGSDAG